MKLCPECKTEFDDSETACPEHGEVLVPSGPKANPRLPGTRTVDHGAHTAMFTMAELEKEAERLEAPEPDPSDAATEGQPGLDSVPQDPNATRVLSVEQLERMRDEREAKKGGTQVISSGGGSGTELLPQPPEPSRVRGTLPGAPVPESSRVQPRPPKKSSRALWLALLLLLLLGGTGAGVWFGFLRKVPLQLVSVPPGATLLLDNVELGTAPLSLRVLRGTHGVEARLEGYQDASEVIDATGAEHAHVITLKKRAAAPVNTPAVDPLKEKADALDREARAFLDKGKLEEAELKWQALAALVPEDPRPPEGLAEIGRRRIGKAGKGKKAADPAAAEDGEIATLKPADRTRTAQKFLEQGRTAYEMGDMGKAKDLLSRCVRFNPNSVQCHRLLARVYTREDNVDKTKYHLQRYLELGGPDEDFKVRDWLRAH